MHQSIGNGATSSGAIGTGRVLLQLHNCANCFVHAWNCVARAHAFHMFVPLDEAPLIQRKFHLIAQFNKRVQEKKDPLFSFVALKFESILSQDLVKQGRVSSTLLINNVD